MISINIPADGLFLAVENHANGDLSKENCKRIIDEYIGKILKAEPDVILLNVCYRRALTPSEVFDSYLYDIETDANGYAIKDENGKSIKQLSPIGGGTKYFACFFNCARILLKNGIDIYQFAIERIKKQKVKVYLSVRMNDEHYTFSNAINSSFALKNSGEHTILKDGCSLDFSQEAVRNYYLEYIKELVGNYSVDGVEMDWLRVPNVLPLSKSKNHQILSEYMQKVRKLLDAYDKNLSLSVRILPTEEELINGGLDVSEWICNGSVDTLTIENFYIPTNYEMPVQKWRESIDKRNVKGYPYKILCGTDWAVSCTAKYDFIMNPALVRGFTETCLSSGADGVYLFNFFEEDDYSSFERIADGDGVKLKTCFLERMVAAKRPNELPRRYVHIGNTNERYPIVLESGYEYSFVKTIREKYQKCKLIIGSEFDLPYSVLVNGTIACNFNKEPVYQGYEYIPKEQVKKKCPFIYAVTQAAPIVISVDITEAVNGSEDLEIRIKNTGDKTNQILWIELACE